MTETAPPIPPDFRNDDPGVQKLVEFLEFGERTIPYWHLVHRVARCRNHSFAYVYVGAWLLILIVLLSTSVSWSEWSRPARAMVAALAAYRMWDIGRWWLDLLINRRHYKVVSRERNVLFLALNLFELVFIGAIFFRAVGVPGTVGDAWFHSFFLVTQLALPEHLVGVWDLAAAAAVELTALVLLLGGLAALIDVIGSKIREGDWLGPHDWRSP